MCKHDNLKQRKYKLIPVLILKGVGAQNEPQLMLSLHHVLLKSQESVIKNT